VGWVVQDGCGSVNWRKETNCLEMRDEGARQIWPRTVSTALGTFGIDPTA
jgi:hypothetical protein